MSSKYTLRILLSFSIFFLGLFNSNFAQIFDVDTIIWNGLTEKRINYVFLADGYQESELNQFIMDVEEVTDDLFNTTPFFEYRNYFNVFAIKVPSNESGAKHPGTANDEPGNQPITEVDNYFGSTFDFADIHRLVVATNNFQINNVLAANFPDYDQSFILVNSPYYGGSGGSNAVSTTHVNAGEIAIHEIGHSFANLSDEYFAGDQFLGESPNMTSITDPALVKWKNWYGDEDIGIFQHCCGGNSANWYKPHQNCKMQFLGVPFCAVCKETFIESIHDLVSPIDSYEPLSNQIDLQAGQEILFKLDIIETIPNTITTIWQLNGTTLANTADELNLPCDILEEGVNTLSVHVIDEQPLSRWDAHSAFHAENITWSITKTLTSIETTSTQQQIYLSVFPNPVNSQLIIEYEIEKASEIRIQFFDLNGKMLNNTPKTNQPSGKHQQLYDLKHLPSGQYLLRFLIDGGYIDKRILKIN